MRLSRIVQAGVIAPADKPEVNKIGNALLRYLKHKPEFFGDAEEVYIVTGVRAARATALIKKYKDVLTAWLSRKLHRPIKYDYFPSGYQYSSQSLEGVSFTQRGQSAVQHKATHYFGK